MNKTMKNITIIANIKINDIGKGGHLFYTSDVKKNPWLGVWMFKEFETRDYLSSWVYIYYTSSEKFEPGKLYKVKINLIIEEDKESFFIKENKFKIQAGILYDNKYWATGEILEILDENETTNN